MPWFAEQEMLIHSTKMETVVFIQDTHLPQESSTTSKDNLESRGLQSRTTRPMLGLISVLVLLVVGMVGLCIWMYLYPFAEKINTATSTAADSTTHCERVNMNINMSEENIFNVPCNGTYFIYGRVKREHSKTNEKCQDMIRLCWNKTNNPDCIERNFTSNSLEAEIIVLDVQLAVNSEISLNLNCEPVSKKASFRIMKV